MRSVPAVAVFDAGGMRVAAADSHSSCFDHWDTLETSVRSEAMLTWNGTRGDPRSENRGRPATGSNAPPRQVVPVVGNTSPPANLSSAYSQLVGACGHAGVTRLAWISYTDGRNRPMYGRSR